jgi:hypothetical protein
MEPRLQSSVLVSALIKRAEAEGGFAAVLAKGDSSAGSILVILVERGGKPRFLERVLQPNGSYAWQDTGGEIAVNDEEAGKFLAKRRKFDPDLWILELDVPSVERFTAEMNESV